MLISLIQAAGTPVLTGWRCVRGRSKKLPDKTFIGRVERGFDFLGYHLTPGRLTLSVATVERFVARAHRLHERERGKPSGFPLLDAYVRRWERWTRAGGVHPVLAALPQGGGV